MELLIAKVSLQMKPNLPHVLSLQSWLKRLSRMHPHFSELWTLYAKRIEPKTLRAILLSPITVQMLKDKRK